MAWLHSGGGGELSGVVLVELWSRKWAGGEVQWRRSPELGEKRYSGGDLGRAIVYELFGRSRSVVRARVWTEDTYGALSTSMAMIGGD